MALVGDARPGRGTGPSGTDSSTSAACLLGLARPQLEHRGLPRGLKRAALRPDLVDAAGRNQGQGGLCPEI
jgi:hypothetical protein